MVGAARSRTYKVDFYVVTHDELRVHPLVSNFLVSLPQVGPALALGEEANERHQIRSLVPLRGGRVFKGVFGRCRYNETPLQAADTGEEAEVELLPGHGLVEKNHFLYFSDRNLLVYQRNQLGSHHTKLQRYLNSSIDDADRDLLLEPILTTDAYDRLLNGPDVKWVDVSFQPPRDPSLYTHHSTSDAIRLVNGVGGLNARVRISVGRSGGSLLGDVKEFLVTVAKHGLARVARAKLDDEEGQLIDLITARIVGSMSVPLQDNGRPTSEDIYAGLTSAEIDNRDDLQTFFGR